jgi:hypothetical protein
MGQWESHGYTKHNRQSNQKTDNEVGDTVIPGQSDYVEAHRGKSDDATQENEASPTDKERSQTLLSPDL